ncbi:MAG: carboxypeptidase-like regulatory domain-containing protein [Bacteroidales bacterium]|nr:carboxypeptidase-like regulatory domain-containing protein [Bacteroidales bacterium]
MNYFLLILLSVFEFIYPLYPQNANTDLIQFSGVVVSSDSLQPIAFTNVIIENSNRGTISDYYGFFSIVAQKKDTIIFSAVGYKKNKFIIPDTLTVNRYSLIQVMSYDTIMLSETVIYPWPTLEQFKQAFMKVEIPDDDLERAKKNLALSEMKERYMNMPMDGSMNFKNLMDNKTSRLYYAGQYPPNNLLNPIAWAKFIQAWREGKFKRKN